MMTGYLIWIAVALSGSTVYSIFTDSGCLDGTTDALQDEQHPDVAGCTGSWHGHIKNGSTLCAPGWRVCSWHNTEHLQTLTYDTATNLTGCFAYNAAQKQGQCKPCVAKVNQDDLAGIGSGCPHQSSGGTSCLSDGGHVSASCCDDVIHRMACHFKSGVTSGVLCCRQPGVAPQIIVNPREMTHVMTGATFVLSCQAMGVPTPSITWSKNGHPLVQGNPRVAVFDSGYLLISEAQLSDSGYYWCRVTNSVGSDDARAKVVVTDHESGCADGTTDALQQYEDIQGCRGKWSGHVKRAKSLCARGWQVCSPRHNNVIKLLTWADVSETKGCYAYNSANTLNQCSRCHTQGSDMAGVGGGCGRVRRSYRSCLAQGRIDVYKSRLTPGCSYKKSSTTGVMCCRRNNKPPPSLWTAPPKCQPKCSNGGRCISNNRCQCANGYKGVWCQNPICSGGCIPNSVCIKPNTCRCRSGHVGAKCKPRAEQCKATCLNGGRCRNGKCKCPKGWTGTYCHHTVETKHWHKSSDMNRTE